MSRKKRVYNKKDSVDFRYQSKLIEKLINKLMKDGKKSVSQHIVYHALEKLSKKMDSDPIEAFTKVFNRLKPEVEVRSRRVGGSTYQVPVEVGERRGNILAFRWLIKSVRKHSHVSMIDRLADEMWNVSQGSGLALKNKEDMYKMAESNRAFASYKW